MDKEIGAGRYGTVFKTTDKVTGKRFALKHIKMEGETQGFPVTAIREIKILKALDHENIIQLEEVITYGNEQPGKKENGALVHSQGSDMDLSQFLKGSVFMVFEYVEFDMSALILSMRNMTPDHVKCYMKQLLSGIFYMHRQKILHRDLKSQNIFLTHYAGKRPEDCRLGPGSLRVYQHAASVTQGGHSVVPLSGAAVGDQKVRARD